MERFPVLKVTAKDGRQFVTNQTVDPDLASLPNVALVEHLEMTEEEYKRIPATQDAADFFAGKPRISRPA